MYKFFLILLRKSTKNDTAFAGFVIVHQDLFDALAGRFLQTASSYFAAYGANGDLRAEKMLVNRYTTDKSEGQRILVCADKIMVALAYGYCLRICIYRYMPWTKDIAASAIRQ